MIDVLIVDDSALMRRYLAQILEADSRFKVRRARNGEAALAMMAEQLPDLVTLDINMPEMDGLTCLSHIMTRHPCPVIMVSSLTEKGALATLEAIELGAIDYLAKPGGTVSHNLANIADELLDKVDIALSARPQIRTANQRRSAAQPKDKPQTVKRAAENLVLVGVSTGGPGALEALLAGLPERLDWPLVITQHMPATFTSVLANRLNGLTDQTVVEVSRPTPLLTNHIYLAKGDCDLEIRRRGGRLMAVPLPANDDLPWHPSTDRLVASAMLELDSSHLIGVLLTGMGDDGAQAMTELHRRGAVTLAESESSCVVYGMPRALIEAGGASEILPIDAMGRRLGELMTERA